MNIAIIGAAGLVGAPVVEEARNRGHQVSQYTRSGSGTGESQALDLADTQAVVEVINNADVTLISVASRDNYQAAIDAHTALIAAKPTGRFVVVGGAGALNAGEQRLFETPEFPAEYLPEAKAFGQVFDAYANSHGLQWTMIAPSPVIAPGVRTGEYVEALDTPAGGFVSTQDFAVAIVDEMEAPKHAGRRFTVASADEPAAQGA
ncbi:NAD(P)H-binding protein [Corynebacterium sp. 153RC1]|uniref:NAD(P)-dependent oxidoreductase n=1 Tax=unclassified Corynebacterium TaxID=2624378 RepID=UPI00211CDD5F|nr:MULTISPECIES: NAD(P)H-binding protein [unclassified Corynebacterium]MCQ9353305.1 NAD(P)H-binding protein [Corynebacterium sp. 209RC1]MCQ9355555.1 NAD(P)H-binding protein [Corynebacterium sp. 1222RC1]MCQ9357740.1 NAD(P)H-binding protein [Corynebacterium sp. 122RC1]MCQ9359927.1 NAD(P)H-binding protein [Corynebacterium sp. 142RC1]MCQ9362081.1 NAD(P)H-binding protein [Corynebacterium sp. 153RC1]